MSSTNDAADAQTQADQNGNPTSQLHTLAIDIGGTGLKASVLDEQGRMIADRVRVDTPHPSPPNVVVEALVKLVGQLPPCDRVSVGFPGVVRKGKILTAHNLGQEDWYGFDLREALERQLGKPVKVKNDADVQGLGAIRGQGVEMVITLGTGFGTALFDDGWIAPHIELAHHPFRKGQTYEEQLGDAALHRVGPKKWNRRVQRAIETIRHLTNFDTLFIGGGNARHVEFDLPNDVERISNDDGMLGGIWLWRSDRQHLMAGSLAAREGS
ncbi:MAG TPA: ROK family protein [Pirellulales bacterium]|nr:ROK family protein [Pirellulales bacterium]